MNLVLGQLRLQIDSDNQTYLYLLKTASKRAVTLKPGLEVNEPFILKKLAASGTRVEMVSVEGARGFYLGGSPHLVLLLDESGNVIEESVRLARNVLVWEANGVAYRLEGDFTRDEALALAGSLR